MNIYINGADMCKYTKKKQDEERMEIIDSIKTLGAANAKSVSQIFLMQNDVTDLSKKQLLALYERLSSRNLEVKLTEQLEVVKYELDRRHKNLTHETSFWISLSALAVSLSEYLLNFFKAVLDLF